MQPKLSTELRLPLLLAALLSQSEQMVQKNRPMILRPDDDPLDENLARKLKSQASSGRLVRIRRARYVDKSDWLNSSPEEQHLLKMHSIDSAAHRKRPVFSQESAAVLWGIPVGELPGRVSVNVPADSGHRSRGDPIEPGNWFLDGLAVTGKLQTAVELALNLPMAWGVAAMDRVLNPQQLSGEDRPRLVTKADVDAVAMRLVTESAIRRVRRVLDFADPRAGSAAESISRVNIYLAGFPAPQLQTRHEDQHGLIGFSDFAWREFGLIGEFDGMSKYRNEIYLKGQSSADVIQAEKHREERLRKAGWSVTRWMWDTAVSPGALRDHLLRAGLRPL